MTDLTLLAHPLTVAIIVILAGAAGWNIRTLMYLSRRAEINNGAINVLTQTSKDIKELLNLFIEEHRLVKIELSGLKTDVAELKAEHKSMTVVHEKKRAVK